MNTESILVITGYSTDLEAIVYPENASREHLVWRSDDDSIASVDEAGKVTGVSPGSVSITVSTEDERYSAVCAVTVRNGFVLKSGVNVAEIPVPVVITGSPKFPVTVSNTLTAVPLPFVIMDSDITYEVWVNIRSWADSSGLGYDFSGVSAKNGSDLSSNGYSASDSASMQYPVTNVSWNQAIVWCNALTEYYNISNGTALECVYEYGGVPIRKWNDPNISSVTTDVSKKGFRLPSNNEFEYAARYQGGVSSTNSIMNSGIYYTSGDSLSGATDEYTDNDSSFDVAVFGMFYGGADTGVTGTAKVKSKKPNYLGLYDMSGNIWKWCDQISSTTATAKGGDFTSGSYDCTIGNTPLSINKTSVSSTIGFRCVRSL